MMLGDRWVLEHHIVFGGGADGRDLLVDLDVLQCTADELNFGLSLFVNEVRKPNGDPYAPDSIYYLCLGISFHTLTVVL